MSSDLYIALGDCLALLQSGADLEYCLGMYPADADRLRPLLAAAIQARSLADDSIPQEAMRRGRATILNQAAEIREEQRSRRRQAAFSFQRVLRFSFALLLAVVILVGAGGTGLVNASSSALPGDRLYGVKLTWENIQLKLANSEAERLTLEEEFEQERLTEVDGLLSRERQERVKFSGRVDLIQEGSLLVSGVMVLVSPETRIDGQVLPGTWVEVAGWTAPGAVVNASRIRVEDTNDAPGDEQGEDRSGSSGNAASESDNGKDGDKTNEGSDHSGSSSASSESDAQPGSSETRNGQRFDFEGLVTALSGGSIQVDGRVLMLSSAAEIRGQPSLGTTVRVQGFIDAAENWVVTRIVIREVLNSGMPQSGGDNSGDSSGREPTKTPKPE